MNADRRRWRGSNNTVFICVHLRLHSCRTPWFSVSPCPPCCFGDFPHCNDAIRRRLSGSSERWGKCRAKLPQDDPLSHVRALAAEAHLVGDPGEGNLLEEVTFDQPALRRCQSRHCPVDRGASLAVEHFLLDILVVGDLIDEPCL